MYATGGPHGRSPIGARWFGPVLIMLGVFVLIVFLADKLVLAPTGPGAAPLSNAIAHLEKHDVRRVTIPAGTALVELNDGSKMMVTIPSDRDLGPIVRRSGADLAIVTASSETPVIAYVLQFVPFIVMALLLIFVLRTAARRQMR